LASSVAALLTSAIFSRLKRRFRRRRPCELEPWLLHEILPPDRFSFPSGHAATSFAVATVLGLAYPALAPAFVLVAVAVATSRVTLGLHYVGDVMAGGLLGAAIGLLSYRALLS
jgi:undecaprenyl-diphosphatase